VLMRDEERRYSCSRYILYLNGMDSCSVDVDDRDRSRNFDGLQKVRESILMTEREAGP
jgi:hypothetical protein